MKEKIHEKLEIPVGYHAAGTRTRFSGPPMREEAADAMREAATTPVKISELQKKASDLLQKVTGAESGYVTTGSSSSLTLASAACIARDDLGVMSRLPDTTGVADEIIMPRIQRNEYDHAIRASGAKIVDVGVCNYAMGMGSSTNVEKWELEDAVTENTAAFAYVPWKNTQLQLDTVIDVAHEHNLPVIVDAAGTIPPTSNLSYFIDKGADLVIFSGGKAIRGPQSTGILAGRKDLVRSAALQHLDWGVFEEVWDPPSELIEKEKISGVPRHGIGRGFKVGREELAGFITALELFVDEDDEKVKEVWEERSQKIKEKLNSPTIDKIIVDDGPAKTPIDTEVRSDYLPTVYIHLDLDKSKINAWELVKSLRNEDPRIFVKADVTDKSMFAMTTMSITNEDIDYIVNRILENIE